MTPEDTPRMAERTDRQAQIDLWDSVHQEFADMSQWETVRVYRTDAVDAARAADAALLRERDAQIASLTAERDEAIGVSLWVLREEPSEHGEYAHALHCNAGRREPMGNDGCSCPTGRRIKSLRAERDTAQQENAKLAKALEGFAAVALLWRGRQEAFAESASQDLRDAAGWIGGCAHDVETILDAAALSSSLRPQEPQP